MLSPQGALDLGPVAVQQAEPESEEVVGDAIGAPLRPGVKQAWAVSGRAALAPGSDALPVKFERVNECPRPISVSGAPRCRHFPRPSREKVGRA